MLYISFVFYFFLIALNPIYNFFLKTTHFVLFSAIILFFIWFQMFFHINAVFLHNQIIYITFTNLTETLATLPCTLSFTLNALSFCFCFLVLFIGACTNLYIFAYFKGEANVNNFAFWLNAFILSMLILVSAANLFTLFLGWELIGLTSFFLINFWHNRRATLKSSFKAFVFNLFSDICLMGAFAIFFLLTGSDDCSTIIYITLYTDLAQHVLFQLGTFLFFCCCGIKSVQLLGHLWLPDSMEAPVPASSLIHSATLVSAGIFLLCKFFPILILSSWHFFFLNLGGVTALYGGVVASAQTDLKKLLAYSTMSHCGFLWTLACAGNFYITVLYLFLHGVFKAATFYCSGTFIRFFGTQDSRWMGAGLKFLPVSSYFFLFASINLAGLPFTAGYMYKFYFLKFVFISELNFFIITCFVLAALTSLVYFYRLVFYVLFDFFKTVKQNSFWYFGNSRVMFLGVGRFFRNSFLIATSMLFLFGYLTIIFFSLQHVFSVVFYCFETENVYYFLTNKTQIFFNSYYVFFYNFYLFLSLTLIICNNNKNIYSLKLQNVYLYFLCGLCFLFIMCELTLWLKHLL